ncbi:hypothetical protein C8A05DRAFT_31090 [Staphylotrichum tortipilum]|uniref:Methyltransferase n=1 Tax=Staphylotrichum tortipilum TaxID=2831512 RepID=A0AAN6MQM6_9PEZI|nr:hypothetical protein C8A05DRAFT_31090 [Staphylotrichum longicolle]
MGDSTSPKPASPSSGRASPAKSPPKSASASGSPPPATAGSSSGQAPAGTGVLEADTNALGDDSDADSAVSAGDLSDTTSVLSSIYKFREENGRTYHSYKADESAYFLPNDEVRLTVYSYMFINLQHNICMRMQDNELFISPAGKDKPLKRVLDCGTGTGIWAIEFADEHPEAQVVGVDLSPIQPSFVAPNVEFFIDDLEAEWNYHTKFDLIYGRLLTGSIRNWPKLIAQAFDNLNPGGYLELCESINPIQSDDGTLKDDSAILRWNRMLVVASEKLGASLNSGRSYKQQLLDAGFEDVTQVEYKWPLNAWPKDAKYKELGTWTFVNMISGIQAVSLMLFTNILGWSAEEVEVLLVDVRKEAKNKDIHAYWPVYVVYGRKPEAE